MGSQVILMNYRSDGPFWSKFTSKFTMMKKLSLEMLRLSTNEILERSQMKKITGGRACNHTLTCEDGTQFSGSGNCPTEATLACSDNGGSAYCVETGCS